MSAETATTSEPTVAPGQEKLAPGSPVAWNRGVFTLSLDFEMIWGTVDLFGPAKFAKACEVEREAVVRLLDLFVEFEVPATWCTQGHLFLTRCDAQEGRKHPEIIRPNHAWCRGDWFDHDPGGDERTAPVYFARSLIEKILACPVPQEVGCHTFSHVIMGDPGCSRATAESELRECVRLARELGVELASFAFPRNIVGHLDVLRQCGFRCYRGPEPVWYENDRWPAAVRRAGHLWDVLTAAEPPVVRPTLTESGIWNVPGSMIYFPMHGFRRHIPLGLRVARARKGLDAARRERAVFHLWFHPTNLVFEMDAMFEGLRRILAYAARLRERGEIEMRPMKDLAPA